MITRREKIAEYLFEVHKILCLSIEDEMHLKRHRDEDLFFQGKI